MGSFSVYIRNTWYNDSQLISVTPCSWQATAFEKIILKTTDFIHWSFNAMLSKFLEYVLHIAHDILLKNLNKETCFGVAPSIVPSKICYHALATCFWPFVDWKTRSQRRHYCCAQVRHNPSSKEPGWYFIPVLHFVIALVRMIKPYRCIFCVFVDTILLTFHLSLKREIGIMHQ